MVCFGGAVFGSGMVRRGRARRDWVRQAGFRCGSARQPPDASTQRCVTKDEYEATDPDKPHLINIFISDVAAEEIAARVNWAVGGPTEPGREYLIGEHGPEAII